MANQSIWPFSSWAQFFIRVASKSNTSLNSNIKLSFSCSKGIYIFQCRKILSLIFSNQPKNELGSMSIYPIKTQIISKKQIDKYEQRTVDFEKTFSSNFWMSGLHVLWADSITLLCVQSRLLDFVWKKVCYLSTKNPMLELIRVENMFSTDIHFELQQTRQALCLRFLLTKNQSERTL